MVKFFIDRPKFAIVLSILMTLMGVLSIINMPVGQYPDVAPPSVNVFTNYRGANAQVVNDTVASVIEKQVNGVEGMQYMRSNSSNDGSYSLDITFEVGFDADRAATLVQNRVNAAMPLLPDEVKRGGVFVEKVSPSMLMILTLQSPNGTHDGLTLSNYASSNVKERLARLGGVSKVELLGEKEYAMRIWVKPERLDALDITPSEVIAAVVDQNAVRAAGTVGAEPVVGNNAWQYTVNVRGRLAGEKEFGDIRLRTDADGTIIHLKDVADIELGANQYMADAYINNADSIGLAVYQDPSANAMEVARLVKETMTEFEQSFPDDMTWATPYDSTLFIDVSLYNVYETLIIAVLLVTLVTYVFLQTWQATLIPAIAIPVSLIGTFAVMDMLGSTINTISLFGLVLAIGVVVDAAIVVIENVERLLHESDKPVKECVIDAMAEVTGPCVASAAVLLAVFGPTLAMPGMTGILYSEFGIAISISVVISTIVALTLTPALCVLLMHRGMKPPAFLQGFNRGFDRLTAGFSSTVSFLIRKLVVSAGIFAIMLAGLTFLGKTLPSGFLPDEDQGAFFATVQLPEGASLQRTREEMNLLAAQIQQDPAVDLVMTVPGYDLLNSSTNSSVGMVVVSLKHWDQRKTAELHQDAVLAKVQAAIDALPDGGGFAFSMPAIPALGMVNGFEVVLKDDGGKGPEALNRVLQETLAKASDKPEIAAAFSTFSVTTPNLYLDIDEERASLMGVDFGDIVNTINSHFGGVYINDYTLDSRNYMVMLQARSDSRQSADDLSGLYVRSASGEAIRVSNLVEASIVYKPTSLLRYNVSGSAVINGVPAAGVTSGDAIKAMEAVLSELPQGYNFEWTGLTLEQNKAGNATVIAFSLALIFTYLFLVAQYESWLTPVSILLTVPSALIGIFAAVKLTGGDINLYTQIAMILLIGMASRNAILIVEFAKLLREERGYSVFDAAITAAKLRFRALLMTAFSFILGVAPLMIANSAGAQAQKAIGFASFGGMLTATVIGTLLVPVFFYVFQTLREKFHRQPSEAATVASIPSELVTENATIDTTTDNVK
ncbi:efflux RND transporter permease subunit [Photobacterium sanguinicancri]|uniref:efflux RND transporter permease subunit n=1 Tax=Photobacterium sanguinicancri TaxID=875932 RepID=UPI003D0C41FB